MNKFLQFCINVVAVIMIILTGYLFLLSIFGTSMINVYVGYETTVYLTDNPLLHISAIILILLLGYLLSSSLQLPILSKERAVKILIGIYGITAVIMMIAIFICNYLPVTAQYWTLDAANRLITADYSFWEHSGFSYIYPMLNSLILFLVPEVFFFGMEGGTIAFRIFNLIMLFLSSYFLYGFCKETKLKGTAVSLLYILYLPLSLYVFFIYGNVASLSFSILAIWMSVRYLTHHKTKDILLCIFAITAGILFKDTTIITMIAILIVLGVYSIISHQWKQLLWIPVFILVYMVSCLAVDTIIENITHEDVPAGMSPYGHLTMGLSEGTPDNGNRANGWYNNFTLDTLIACDFDYDLYQEITKAAFLQRSKVFWSDPSYAIEFLAKKTASQWNNPTFQSIWIHQQMLSDDDLADYSLYVDGSTTNMVFYYIFNLLQSLILFGSLCYFIFEARKASLASLIPAITFIGGFIFLLFWEAKAQYTLLFFVMLFPYAVTGLISLSNGLTSLIQSCNPKTDNTQTTNSKEWYRSKEIIFLGLILCIILLLSLIHTESINNTIKPGTADADALYEYYLEQNVNYYNQFTGH